MTSDRLAEAFAYALDRHRAQQRKGTRIPYISHLMQVAGLVMEYGGDEEQTIAALLHDAIEDAPAGEAETVREQIRIRFGQRVSDIVEGCSDADTQPKPEWRPRKELYLAHLDKATDDVLLVSAADKLHNARAILTDLKEVGSALWDRFTGERSGTLWYYRSLVQAYRAAAANRRLVEDLDDVVSEIERRASGIDSSAPNPYEIH
jgi:(p)ppGpp synthase/HD superfamily hydrolase